jgi:hypothetical protein
MDGPAIPDGPRWPRMVQATRRPARIHREAVTFAPHDGARCVAIARSNSPVPGSAGGVAAALAGLTRVSGEHGADDVLFLRAGHVHRHDNPLR